MESPKELLFLLQSVVPKYCLCFRDLPTKNSHNRQLLIDSQTYYQNIQSESVRMDRLWPKYNQAKSEIFTFASTIWKLYIFIVEKGLFQQICYNFTVFNTVWSKLIISNGNPLVSISSKIQHYRRGTYHQISFQRKILIPSI